MEIFLMICAIASIVLLPAIFIAGACITVCAISELFDDCTGGDGK